MKAIGIIGTTTSLAIIAFAIVATVPTYRFAPTFLIPLTWLPVIFGRRLNLHPLYYAMYCVGILLHTSGAMGYYQRSPLPFSFDIAVHFYFAFAATFLLHRAIASNFVLKRWQVSVSVLMFMMGFAALHEIMEYGSYLLLGEEKGMLKPKTSYSLDTARDLTNNLFGTLLALAIINVAAVVAARARTSSTREARSPAPAPAPLRSM
jgi:uncharacterized membrane protein YjdF